MWGIAMKKILNKLKPKDDEKRNDKKRNQLIRRIAIGTIAFWFSSMLILYISYFTHFENSFNDAVYRVRESSNFNFSNVEEDVLTKDNFIYHYHENNKYPEFPVALALYDTDGKLVHTSGPMYIFKYNYEEYKCFYLDEFNNAEFENKKQELYEKYDDVSVEGFRFYEKDGSAVLTEVVFDCVIFNEEYEDTNQRESIKLFDYQGETEYVNGSYGNFTFSYGFYHNHDEKYYKKLVDFVKSERAVEYINRCFNTETIYIEDSYGGLGYMGDDFAHYYYEIEIQGESYYVVLATGYNAFLRIIDDNHFVQQTLLLSLFIQIISGFLEYIFTENYDKNKRLEENKSAFASAVAHELKTPVAIIQNQCECILENVAPEKNELYIKSIYEETKKMNELVTNLLQFNRLSQTDKVALEECDFKNLVSEEINKYGKSFEINEKNVTFELEDVPLIKCNRQLMSLVVDNILSNAVKHSDKGGEIKIDLKRVGDNRIMLTIFNTGSHIEESKLKDIWSVMYKGDESRTDRSSSGGMGLAISAKILDLHNAYYSCKNNPDGVSFYIML